MPIVPASISVTLPGNAHDDIRTSTTRTPTPSSFISGFPTPMTVMRSVTRRSSSAVSEGGGVSRHRNMSGTPAKVLGETPGTRARA